MIRRQIVQFTFRLRRGGGAAGLKPCAGGGPRHGMARYDPWQTHTRCCKRRSLWCRLTFTRGGDGKARPHGSTLTVGLVLHSGWPIAFVRTPQGSTQLHARRSSITSGLPRWP